MTDDQSVQQRPDHHAKFPSTSQLTELKTSRPQDISLQWQLTQILAKGHHQDSQQQYGHAPGLPHAESGDGRHAKTSHHKGTGQLETKACGAAPKGEEGWKRGTCLQVQAVDQW